MISESHQGWIKPRDFIHRSDWDQLLKANQLMRAARITDAMVLYEELLYQPGDHFLSYFAEYKWPLGNDPITPSANWACLYLAEYYLQTWMWDQWRAIAAYIIPYLEHLDPNFVRSFNCVYALSIVNTEMGKLPKLTRPLQKSLKLSPEGSLDAGMHHIVLGYLYRHLRREKQCLKHYELAVSTFQINQYPLYAIFSQSQLADAYYHFHDNNAGFVEKAVTLYNGVYCTPEIGHEKRVA